MHQQHKIEFGQTLAFETQAAVGHFFNQSDADGSDAFDGKGAGFLVVAEILYLVFRQNALEVGKISQKGIQISDRANGRQALAIDAKGGQFT